MAEKGGRPPNFCSPHARTREAATVSDQPHARTIEFLTQVLGLGLRVWLGPFDITEACKIALDRIARDQAHA